MILWKKIFFHRIYFSEFDINSPDAPHIIKKDSGKGQQDAGSLAGMGVFW